MPDFDAECKSISSGPDDNGFLDGAKKFFGAPPESANTPAAAKNIGSCVGTTGLRRRALLVGHGNVGYIKTGNGNQGGNDEQYLANYNASSWRASMRDQLKERCLSLVLCSCDTGADDAGAELLYYLSSILKTVVSAPTYFVWYGGGKVYLDPKAEWQTASLGIRPDPKKRPSGSIVVAMTVNLKINDKFEILPNEVIESIAFRQVNSQDLHKHPRPLLLDDSESRALVKSMGLTRPRVEDAVPAAITTGYIDMIFRDSLKRRHLKTFRIYNNTLIHDEHCPGVYYEVSPDFAKIIQSF